MAPTFPPMWFDHLWPVLLQRFPICWHLIVLRLSVVGQFASVVHSCHFPCSSCDWTKLLFTVAWFRSGVTCEAWSIPYRTRKFCLSLHWRRCVEIDWLNSWLFLEAYSSGFPLPSAGLCIRLSPLALSQEFSTREWMDLISEAPSLQPLPKRFSL